MRATVRRYEEGGEASDIFVIFQVPDRALASLNPRDTPYHAASAYPNSPRPDCFSRVCLLTILYPVVWAKVT